MRDVLCASCYPRKYVITGAEKISRETTGARNYFPLFALCAIVVACTRLPKLSKSNPSELGNDEAPFREDNDAACRSSRRFVGCSTDRFDPVSYYTPKLHRHYGPGHRRRSRRCLFWSLRALSCSKCARVLCGHCLCLCSVFVAE